MDISELVSAYVSTGQKIDVLWNFYVTVHLAIAGLLLYSKPKALRSLSKLVVTVISVSYLAFSVINFRAKHVEYEFLVAVTESIQSGVLGHKSMDMFFENNGFSDRGLINIVIHLTSALFIYIIYWKSRSTNRSN